MDPGGSLASQPTHLPSSSSERLFKRRFLVPEERDTQSYPLVFLLPIHVYPHRGTHMYTHVHTRTHTRRVVAQC